MNDMQTLANIVGMTAEALDRGLLVWAVRCKDCKHRPTREREDATGFALEFPDYICPCQCEDGWYSWYPPDEWYCASGERRTQ